jgi:hypothetical protein
VFKTGAKRDRPEGKGRFDLFPYHAMTLLAQHFENGAVKYADRNWEGGIPVSVYVDSGLRHGFKYAAGLIDEPHAIAAAWNFLCAMETEVRVSMGLLPPELLDGMGPLWAYYRKDTK